MKKNVKKFFLLIFLSAVFFSAPSLADTVYVANEAGYSIGVFSWPREGESAEFPVTGMPHNVQAVEASGLILATVMDHADPTKGMLAVFDSTKMESGPVKTIAVGAHPAHVVTDLSGKKAFVTLSGENAVAVVDLEEGKVLSKIGIGDFPHGLRLSPDGKELYVANMKNDTVSVIDTEKEQEVARIKTGAKPVQVAFSVDGKKVFVSLNGENAVAMIDTAKREMEKKIPVGSGPVQVFANERHLFVANQGTKDNPGTTLSVIDPVAGSVVKEITVGNGPHGVNISKDEKTVFVTNVYDGTVSIIDDESLNVTRTIPVGKEPNGISSLP